MTTHTMQMALASEEDLNVAYDLLGLLDCAERDYYPADDGEEDAPTHLDTDDIEHLRFFYDKLKAIVDRRGSGALHRVVGGFSTVRYAKNQILDLTQDVVALHPRLTAALGAPVRFPVRQVTYTFTHPTLGDERLGSKFEDAFAQYHAAMRADDVVRYTGGEGPAFDWQDFTAPNGVRITARAADVVVDEPAKEGA